MEASMTPAQTDLYERLQAPSYDTSDYEIMREAANEICYLASKVENLEPTASAGQAEPTEWARTRSNLATAMAAFGTRPDGKRGMDAAAQALDAITEPGSPLSWLRDAAPTPAAAQDKDWPEIMSSVQDAEGRVTSATLQVGEVVTRMVPVEQTAATQDKKRECCPHGIHWDNACGACTPPRGTKVLAPEDEREAFHASVVAALREGS
jgi:hypothetical protein